MGTQSACDELPCTGASCLNDLTLILDAPELASDPEEPRSTNRVRIG